MTTLLQSLLPQVVFPGDVISYQHQLRASLEGANETVKSCNALDQATLNAWNAFYKDASEWCNIKVDGFGIDYASSYIYTTDFIRDFWGNSTEQFFETGKAFAAMLVTWQKKLTDAGCQAAGVGHVVPEDPQSGWPNTLKWGAIGLASLAAAYGISVVTPAIAEGVATLRARRKGKQS